NKPIPNATASSIPGSVSIITALFISKPLSFFDKTFYQLAKNKKRLIKRFIICSPKEYHLCKALSITNTKKLSINLR
ncbi:MAG: hypothetical protein E6Y42_14040, partial [Enterococcus gallinarum]|nr:hypothetical protein [Enterococcus gallinarum]